MNQSWRVFTPCAKACAQHRHYQRIVEVTHEEESSRPKTWDYPLMYVTACSLEPDRCAQQSYFRLIKVIHAESQQASYREAWMAARHCHANWTCCQDKTMKNSKPQYHPPFSDIAIYDVRLRACRQRPLRWRQTGGMATPFVAIAGIGRSAKVLALTPRSAILEAARIS
jgi:hypothetical protein